VSDTPDLWFKRKRFGYGWVPATWQGWVAVALYVAGIVVAARSLPDSHVPPGMLILYFGVLLLWTALFFMLVRRKGPKMRWRWGRGPGDDPREDF
jgi:uncharacterized membrane protein YfcA